MASKIRNLFLCKICILSAASYAASLSVPLTIVNGTSANVSDYPYVALLRIQDYPSCGATFISNTTLLTAAHCVQTVDSQSLTIQVGSSVTSENSSEIIQVQSKIPHDLFCSDAQCIDYDIAVVTIVSAPQNFDVVPVKLNEDRDEAGTLGTVLGWGYDGANEGELHKLEVPIKDNAECSEVYYSDVNFSERMMCAGGQGGDYCWGDSGGPLTVGDVLVGIAAWSSGCGEDNKPGVYVNVSKFRSWIQEHTGI
ncbi:trypsin-7-like [Euwallacea fornicatus]|uniref:trypsin-7-like n=1 Tax=Euwallacea fornicatus TaxID=995702 RepID=UPI00338E976A